jgi:hypothetical protein
MQREEQEEAGRRSQQRQRWRAERMAKGRQRERRKPLLCRLQRRLLRLARVPALLLLLPPALALRRRARGAARGRAHWRHRRLSAVVDRPSAIMAIASSSTAVEGKGTEEPQEQQQPKISARAKGTAERRGGGGEAVRVGGEQWLSYAPFVCVCS